MPTRESFFDYPETVGEIIGGRKIVPAEPETLVDVIDNELGPGKAVLVDFGIVPEIDPVEGIPYCKDRGDSLSARFLKRGPQVEVMKHRTHDSAMVARLPAYVDRNLNILATNLSVPMSGYGWRGIRDGQRRKVHLTDCIEGAKIFAYSLQNRKDKKIGRKITVLEYNSGRSLVSISREGGHYLAEVPSTSSDELRHDVQFRCVPLEDCIVKYARVMDIAADQSSKACTKRVSHRYVGGEMLFAKQAIAAYLEIARLEYSQGNKVPIEMCPFAIPSQKTVDFYNRMRRRVLVKEVYTEGGRERTSKRPLNKAEREVLLWQYVAKHRPAESFFAKGKVQDYRWNRMYAPAEKAA